MIEISLKSKVFDVPRIIFTIQGNPRSEAIINCLKSAGVNEKDLANPASQPEYVVFANPAEVVARFESGVSRNSAVVLWDENGSRCFQYHTTSRPKHPIPSWAHGAHWGVAIQPYSKTRLNNCALQIRANFWRRFRQHLIGGWMPWGPGRKGEAAPKQVVLPAETDEIVSRLNDGPDLAAAIAATAYAAELPAGSRISWYRVVPEPAICDEALLTRVTSALASFQRACRMIVRTKPEIREVVLAGVHLADDSRLADLYLDPATDCFSIDRPDLHYVGGGKVFASEIDEMPGGFPEVAHIDRAYGLNESRWQKCFDWLTSCGYLLFLVSHDWSKPYVAETSWLVEYLKSLGYPAAMLTTDRLNELEIRTDGVFHKGTRVGTVWRQFPIFEVDGRLIELVMAAKQGVVRLVPEFAFYGNKTLFSIFWKNLQFFQERLNSEEFGILEQVLPDSSMVRPGVDSFPITAAGRQIERMDDLRSLPDEARKDLVLKVCGANRLAARSYGVLMGHGLAQNTWQQWIEERERLRQPFLVQRCLDTTVAQLAVRNTKYGAGEIFDCRLLLRPWVVGGSLVSVHGCAVPRDTLRVHGRVDMAIVPIKFGMVTVNT